MARARDLEEHPALLLEGDLAIVDGARDPGEQEVVAQLVGREGGDVPRSARGGTIGVGLGAATPGRPRRPRLGLVRLLHLALGRLGALVALGLLRLLGLARLARRLRFPGPALSGRARRRRLGLGRLGALRLLRLGGFGPLGRLGLGLGVLGALRLLPLPSSRLPGAREHLDRGVVRGLVRTRRACRRGRRPGRQGDDRRARCGGQVDGQRAWAPVSGPTRPDRRPHRRGAAVGRRLRTTRLAGCGRLARPRPHGRPPGRSVERSGWIVSHLYSDCRPYEAM